MGENKPSKQGGQQKRKASNQGMGLKINKGITTTPQWSHPSLVLGIGLQDTRVKEKRFKKMLLIYFFKKKSWPCVLSDLKLEERLSCNQGTVEGRTKFNRSNQGNKLRTNDFNRI